MSRSALIVFARPPIAGKVKTRLTSLITPEEAANLYGAFLRDGMEQYGQLDADVHLYMTEAGELNYLSPHVYCHTQIQGSLGQKMVKAFEQTFTLGYERVVIIGTDHPTLPDACLNAAFEALAPPPAITIGPAQDGGYYLLGMTRFIPELFRDMTYSQPNVLSRTLCRTRPIGARVILLPAWNDVDRPEDLIGLRASKYLPKHTEAIMSALQHKYHW